MVGNTRCQFSREQKWTIVDEDERGAATCGVAVS
jgi:hypothetical protein